MSEPVELTINYARGRHNSCLAWTTYNGVLYVQRGKTWDKASKGVVQQVVEDLRVGPPPESTKVTIGE